MYYTSPLQQISIIITFSWSTFIDFFFCLFTWRSRGTFTYLKLKINLFECVVQKNMQRIRLSHSLQITSWVNNNNYYLFRSWTERLRKNISSSFQFYWIQIFFLSKPKVAVGKKAGLLPVNLPKLIRIPLLMIRSVFPHIIKFLWLCAHLHNSRAFLWGDKTKIIDILYIEGEENK